MEKTLSRAQLRNRVLRQELTGAFPGVRFGVRNGRGGSAAISWVDGPTSRQVERAVRQVPSDRPPAPWRVSTDRRCSVLLTAAAYVRAREAGVNYYSEAASKSAAAGSTHPRGPLRSWRILAPELAVSAVTEAQWQAAQVVVGLARQRATNADGQQLVATIVPNSNDEATTSRWLAETVYHCGHVVDAALAAVP